MENPIEYLFFRIYKLFDQFFFYGLSKMEYRAAGFLTFLLWLNFISIFYGFNYQVFNVWSKGAIIFSVLIFFAIIMGYFTRSSTLLYITEKYKNESKKQIRIGYFVLAIYIVFTFLVLIFAIEF